LHYFIGAGDFERDGAGEAGMPDDERGVGGGNQEGIMNAFDIFG